MKEKILVKYNCERKESSKVKKKKDTTNIEKMKKEIGKERVGGVKLAHFRKRGKLKSKVFPQVSLLH